MKNNMKIICRVLAFFIVFSAIFWRINYVMRDKTECQYISSFKDEKSDSIDVIFLGSSQVVVSMEPLQLWNDTGITSYNCATSDTNVPMMYYTAKMAIEKQHPEVIIADVSFICDPHDITATERFHAIWDNYIIEKVKYEAISDIVPEENRFEMYLPIYLYHSRWDRLRQTDFEAIGSEDEFKGARLNREIVYSGTVSALDEYTTETLPINDTAFKYLNMLIDLCDENGTELVLVAMPLPYHAEDEMYLQTLNSVEEVAKKRGVFFENGYKDKELWGLDYYTDFADTAHVNFRGAKKVTNHVEEILLNNFNLEDKRGLKEYISWDEKYLDYMEFINSQCAYKHYVNGTIIDFVSEYQNPFFVNGLWPSNGAYTWSGGKQNDAFFYLDDVSTANELLLTFQFADVYTDEVDKQNIEIYFNENLCCQWSIDKSNVEDIYTCTVPIEYINIDSINHLSVIYRDVQGDDTSQYPQYQDITKCENPYYAVAYEYIQINYRQ